MPVFTAALPTIAKRWKQPKSPRTYEWISRVWYIKWSNSALKGKDLSIQATAQTNLEDIMLSQSGVLGPTQLSVKLG